MVYDCFIFFDEFDLLEIRLTLLDDVVDYFVIVESNFTFSGKKKNYNFKVAEKRFSKWLNKIIYIPIEQSPEEFIFQKDLQSYNSTDGAWQMEYQQRNALANANYLFADNDTILLSDLDEIPDPRVIKSIGISVEPELFEMLFHYYYLNCQNVGYEHLWKGTIICSGKYFKNSTPQLIRDNRYNYKIIENAGWHFSYLGGAEKIKYKIQSFAHTEFNKDEYLQNEHILKVITEGRDIFNRPGVAYKFISVFFYPPFLRKVMLHYPKLVYYPKRDNFFNIVKYKILRILHFFNIDL